MEYDKQEFENYLADQVNILWPEKTKENYTFDNFQASCFDVCMQRNAHILEYYLMYERINKVKPEVFLQCKHELETAYIYVNKEEEELEGYIPDMKGSYFTIAANSIDELNSVTSIDSFTETSNRIGQRLDRLVIDSVQDCYILYPEECNSLLNDLYGCVNLVYCETYLEDLQKIYAVDAFPFIDICLTIIKRSWK